MQVFLRKYQHGLYLSRSRDWTRKLSEALDFGDGEAAIDAGRQLGLEKVDVVFAENGVIICGRQLDSFPESAKGERGG